MSVSRVSCVSWNSAKNAARSGSAPSSSATTAATIAVRCEWSAIDSGPATPATTHPVCFYRLSRTISYRKSTARMSRWSLAMDLLLPTTNHSMSVEHLFDLPLGSARERALRQTSCPRLTETYRGPRVQQSRFPNDQRPQGMCDYVHVRVIDAETTCEVPQQPTAVPQAEIEFDHERVRQLGVRDLAEPVRPVVEVRNFAGIRGDVHVDELWQSFGISGTRQRVCSRPYNRPRGSPLRL